MIGNYCISKSHMCHMTFSLLQHVLKMSSGLIASSKMLTPLANSRLNNRHFTR